MKKGAAGMVMMNLHYFCVNPSLKALVMGMTLDRLVVGIVDTGSDFNPCHGNTEELIAHVKAGVLAAVACRCVPDHQHDLHEKVLLTPHQCICAI